MVPNVTQQLEAMRDAMAKYVLPAVPADQPFATEQAGLILASLGWMIDVNEHQEAYEATEHDDVARLGEALLQLPADDLAGGSELRAALDAPPAADATLAERRVATARLKALTAVVLEGVPAEVRDEAVALYLEAAERQVDREQSWTRMTGLPKDVSGSIGEVLARQRRSTGRVPA